MRRLCGQVHCSRSRIVSWLFQGHTIRFELQTEMFVRGFRGCVWWKSTDCLCVTKEHKPYQCENLNRVSEVHQRVQAWLKDQEIHDSITQNRMSPIAQEFTLENITFLLKDLKIPYCVILKVTSTNKGGHFGGSGGCLRIEKGLPPDSVSTESPMKRRSDTLRSVISFLVEEIGLSKTQLARILYIHPVILHYRSLTITRATRPNPCDPAVCASLPTSESQQGSARQRQRGIEPRKGGGSARGIAPSRRRARAGRSPARRLPS